MKQIALCALVVACGGAAETADPVAQKKEPVTCPELIRCCRDAFGERAYAQWCPGAPDGDSVWTEGAWCIVPLQNGSVAQ